MLGRLCWVSIQLKVSLVPAEAEVGAVAKLTKIFEIYLYLNFPKKVILSAFFTSLLKGYSMCNLI